MTTPFFFKMIAEEELSPKEVLLLLAIDKSATRYDPTSSTSNV
jgi:hypothetical protein